MTSVLLFTLLLCGFGLEVNAEDPSSRVGRCGRFPPGFTWYNGRCYRFVKQERGWYEAEKACNGLSGNLASIQTLDEYDFISDLIYSKTGSHTSTWVGGYKVKKGAWLWSDGSPFTFSGWSPGEPNNSGGKENCMQINLRGRKFVNDADCDIRLSFVCSKEAS
ncbi:galactose-specific lectin nattectin isoform X1 [Fundulus heteroclitus]|uniref:galactose-specific lectin nattectin isoform X1 n=1 Tax=Fundulus heteroclitus TaxID=8078 RepID=UPI00165A202B|nr:galactose-specific lectin nattectin isoform X1 [Fundulus heteroclitus]